MNKPALNISAPKRILIRSTNWIGDAIMTTPAVRSIRENFPGARVSILVLPWVADVFVASPYVDEIILYRKNGEHRGLPGRLRLVKELGAKDFDLVILLQNAFEAGLITWLARIPARAGYSTDGRGFLLTHPVKLRQEVKTVHQVHYYQEMLRGLGLRTGPDKLFLNLPAAARGWAEDFLQDRLRQNGKPVIGFNPGASYGPAKRWPAEKFSELAGLVSSRTDGNILVFGTDDDHEAAAIIRRGAEKHVVDLTGRTTLAQAMALIERCHVFVTNDSGLMHVSAALGTPTAAIFGSTNHVTTGPYSKRSRVIRKEIPCSPCLQTHCDTDFRCMQEIGSSEVFATVLKLLNGRRPPSE